MSPIKGMEHIGLAAENSEKLKDWYVKSLDAEVLFCNGENPPMYLVRLFGHLVVEIYVALHPLPSKNQNRLAGLRHLALRVNSIDEARAFLEAKNVRFTEEPKPAGGGGRVLFFEDLEGNLFHFVERPAGWNIIP